MDSFEEWFGTRLRWLMRLSTVLAGPELAEDLVQDVALKAQRSWPRVREVDHPEAYLRRMLINEHLSFHRRWSRISLPGTVTEPRSDTPSLADQHADRSLLAAEIGQLPPKQRAVIVLRFFEGLDNAAIAATIGCGESTVRTHTTRALARLRVQLTALEDGIGNRQENSHAY